MSYIIADISYCKGDVCHLALRYITAHSRYHLIIYIQVYILRNGKLKQDRHFCSIVDD